MNLALSVNGPKHRKDGYIGHNVNGKTKLEHILVAERALGKPLPKGAEVHHWDRNKGNNDPQNLVICPDHAYHALLHRRMNALEACGNPDWMLCRLCKKHDDPKNMYISPNSIHAYHRSCSADYAKGRRAIKKAQRNESRRLV